MKEDDPKVWFTARSIVSAVRSREHMTSIECADDLANSYPFESLVQSNETGLHDSDGNMIHIGDHVRKPCEINTELHGTWSEYEITQRGIVPVLMYVKSEKGQILPRGYTGQPLSDQYDRKNFMFVTDISTLRPTGLMRVVNKEEAEEL